MFMASSREIKRLLRTIERRARQVLQAGPERAGFLLDNSPAHRAPEVVRWLAERAHRRRFQRDAALRSAELAVLVAERLEPPDAAATGYALAALGNVLRIHERMDEAEEALTAAKQQCEQTRDGALQRRVLSYHASLSNATQQYERAREYLEELRRLAEEHGETFDAGVALISLARTTHYSGDSRLATRHVTEALGVLPPAADADTVLSALYILVARLIDLGAFAEAREYASRTVLLAEAVGGLWPFQHRWLEGRLLREMGEPREAILPLQDAATFFRLSSIEYNEHLVYLDLAQAQLRSGQLVEAEASAQEALEFFQQLRLPKRASDAIELLAQALAAQHLTAAVLRQVFRELDRVSRRR